MFALNNDAEVPASLEYCVESILIAKFKIHLRWRRRALNDEKNPLHVLSVEGRGVCKAAASHFGVFFVCGCEGRF